MPEHTKSVLNMWMKGELINKNLTFIPRNRWHTLNKESWQDPELFPTKEWFDWMTNLTRRNLGKPEIAEDDILQKLYDHLGAAKWFVDVHDFPLFIQDKYVYLKRDYLDKVESKLDPLPWDQQAHHLKRLVRQLLHAFLPKQNGDLNGNINLVSDIKCLTEDYVKACKDDNVRISLEDIFTRIHLKALEVSKLLYDSKRFQGPPQKRGNEGQERERGFRDNFKKRSEDRFENRNPHMSSPKGKPKESRESGPKPKCENCGQESHDTSKCVFKGHPECNAGAYQTPQVRWEGSRAMKACEQSHSSHCFRGTFLSAKDKEIYKFSNSSTPKDRSRSTKGESECHKCDKILLLKADDKSNTCTFSLEIITQEGKGVKASALLDTGALSGDFISASLARFLVDKFKMNSQKTCNVICSAFSNNCRRSEGSLVLRFRYEDEFHNERHLECTCKIAEIDFDVIIGRDTIRQYHLFTQFPSVIQNGSESSRMLTADNAGVVSWTKNTLDDSGSLDQRNQNPLEDTRPFDSPESTKRFEVNVMMNKSNDGERSVSVNPHETDMIGKDTKSNFSTLDPFDMEELGDLRENDLEAIPVEYLANPTSEAKSPQIFGPQSLKTKLTTFIKKYEERFQTNISTVPANVIPFSFTVNNTV